jgi:O-antigen/teichoic acid export membrane protein
LSDTKPHISASSDSHLAATIGKNTIFGILATAVQIGTRLVTVPVVISHLGLGGYGIWSIIMVTGAYMRFGSAGIKSAFQKYVAEATGNGDFETANKLVSTGSISMLAISLVGLVPIAFLSQRLAKASGVTPEFLHSAAASITVLAIIYAISNFGAAFEAIVMGGHRIDLTRKFNTVLSVCEAVAIILSLHLGYGLLAMTLVIGISELLYILFCYLVSHRVVPQMRISLANFSTQVFPELIRFAGSYQLVNVLELFYGAVLPVVILKFFGPDAAGVFAVTTRVVTSCLVAQDALVLPILSGGTMVFASGSPERIRLFLAKAFKVTLAASLPPLAFASVFGATLAFAWTGQNDPKFREAMWLVAAAALFKALSLLQLVLYRASGRALLDNIRQVIRIAVILTVAFFSKRLGFEGVLAGMAGAEFVGVIFMFYAMAHIFKSFSIRLFTSDAVKLLIATALIISTGAIVGLIRIPGDLPDRIAATLRLAAIGAGCMAAAWPALILTNSLSENEKQSLFNAIPFRSRA